jgi:hypothetical protein
MPSARTSSPTACHSRLALSTDWKEGTAALRVSSAQRSTAEAALSSWREAFSMARRAGRRTDRTAQTARPAVKRAAKPIARAAPLTSMVTVSLGREGAGGCCTVSRSRERVSTPLG